MLLYSVAYVDGSKLLVVATTFNAWGSEPSSKTNTMHRRPTNEHTKPQQPRHATQCTRGDYRATPCTGAVTEPHRSREHLQRNQPIKRH